MLDYAVEAVAMAEGQSVNALRERRQLALALTHLVELVGEAASGVPEAIRAEHPQVPWPKIIAMRHRLIHGYHSVDYAILLDTVTQDLPTLIVQLKAILQSVKD
jgi:uncharacterized protein with HEPN domain